MTKKTYTHEELKDIITTIGDALVGADNHLDFCGWGDSWERSCADELMEEVENAVKIYNDFNKGRSH